MRYVIEVTAFAGIVEVDRRRGDLMVYRESRNGAFDGPGGSQQVANHRFCGTDSDLRVITEYRLDRIRLRNVTLRRRCAVRRSRLSLRSEAEGHADVGFEAGAVGVLQPPVQEQVKLRLVEQGIRFFGDTVGD